MAPTSTTTCWSTAGPKEPSNWGDEHRPGSAGDGPGPEIGVRIGSRVVPLESMVGYVVWDIPDWANELIMPEGRERAGRHQITSDPEPLHA